MLVLAIIMVVMGNKKALFSTYGTITSTITEAKDSNTINNSKYIFLCDMFCPFRDLTLDQIKYNTNNNEKNIRILKFVSTKLIIVF
ncbi:hypothetical protein GCM10008915_19900 [Bifidobacterium pullorum subsp. gallinarum]